VATKILPIGLAEPRFDRSRTHYPNLVVSNSRRADSLSMSSNHCQRKIYKESYMCNKIVFKSALPALGTAIVASMLFAGAAAAKEHDITVAYRVTTQGLDVSQPAGVRGLYARLQHAAQIVCTHGMRVDLKPLNDEDACIENSLANAVRSANKPLLTQVYLETHTLRQAAEHGIDVPAQLAAK
jgi:UrcA family protein